MWVFYLISLPLTLGMVLLTLKYFAGPDVPRYVLFTVGYTWFCSISIIILVPADIWTTIIGHDNGGISFFWSWSYWSTFLLTWLVAPLIQGYEDAGDFTVIERLKTSIRVNLVFYFIVGSVGLFGLILVFTMRKKKIGNVLGLAMGCSNTFGLVTGAFLLGFALSEIPKSIWRNSDWTTRQKVLSHKIAKMAVKLDNAHQDLSNPIVVAQATSKQMSKRDPLRPYMDVIDNMLVQMFRKDPLFKPQGGHLGDNDMDYDTDEKSMAILRRHLRGAREEYYRYKSEYMTCVLEALELEDTIKNYERRNATGWKFISSLRPERTGTLGSFFDMTELIWRCIMWKHMEKLLSVILGCMSVAILLAEATLLPSGLDLSLFSILINSVGKEEMLVQVFAFVPLMYMCICTYYSLFKVGMLMFYSLTPRQTSSVNLLEICSMVARYAPPISYNFLNLISLGKNKKTIFEKRMGNIDEAVPFFGEGFNKIYPLIMVIYTLLVACNFFDRILSFFGNWKIFKFQTEVDDLDGFDSSGLIILQKERTWIEQGRKVGEVVIPLARNFRDSSMDLEAGSNNTDRSAVEMKEKLNLLEELKESSSTPSSEVRRFSGHREAISSKYAAIREQNRKPANMKPAEDVSSTKDSLLDAAKSPSTTNIIGVPSSSIASTWATMKSGFQTFKTNIGAKKFIPLRQVEDSNASTAPIFHLLSHYLPNPSKTPNSSATQSQNPNKTLIKPITSFPKIPQVTIQRRHLLLFSLPLSFTFQFNSRSSALPNYDPVSPAEKDASITLSQRVSEAVELLEKGREFQAQGDFSKALEYFSEVVKDYNDFAFSDYARVGRAIALYEVGDKDEAIAEMEDVSISLKGYPEVHAALAAALYSDKHAPLLAENQFTIATLLDPHYTDLSYVRETKHWPPSLVSSLQHFITLS